MVSSVSSASNIFHANTHYSLHQAISHKLPITEITPLITPASVNEKKEGVTPLHLALMCDNFEAASALLNKGADAFQLDKEMKLTSVHLCVSKKQHGLLHEICQQKLNYGQIDTKDGKGKTPLCHACELGDEESVKELLQAGSNVEEKNGEGQWTALHFAALLGHATIVSLLVQKQPNLNNKTKDFNSTPLYLACLQGKHEAAKALLDAGASIDVRNGENGWTALQSAAFEGHAPIVALLLQQGAQILPEEEREDSSDDRYEDDDIYDENIVALFLHSQQERLTACESLLSNALTKKSSQTILQSLREQGVIEELFPNALHKKPEYFHAATCEKLFGYLLERQKEQLRSCLTKLEALSSAYNHDDCMMMLGCLSNQLTSMQALSDSHFAFRWAEGTRSYLTILLSDQLKKILDQQYAYIEKLIEPEEVKESRSLLEMNTHLAVLDQLCGESFSKVIHSTFTVYIRQLSEKYKLLHQKCISRLKTSQAKTPHEQFAATDVFEILTNRFTIGLAKKVGKVTLSPENSFKNTLECSYEDLYKAGLYEGADLLLIGVNDEIECLLENKNPDENKIISVLREKVKLLERVTKEDSGLITSAGRFSASLDSCEHMSCEHIDSQHLAKINTEMARALSQQIAILFITRFVHSKSEVVSKILKRENVQSLSQLAAKNSDLCFDGVKLWPITGSG